MASKLKKNEREVWDVAFLQRLEDCVNKHTDGSWQKFALGAGVKQQTFNHVKLGREPRSDLIRKVCQHYGISIDWLLTGKESGTGKDTR